MLFFMFYSLAWSFQSLDLVPVQSEGRVKPFIVFAHEVMFTLTAEKKLGSEALLSFMAHPHDWEDRAFIFVGPDAQKRLKLGKLVSPRALMRNDVLGQYARGILKERVPDFDALLERLHVFRQISSGEGWMMVPGEPWHALIETGSDTDLHSALIRRAFLEMLRAYTEKRQDDFARASAGLLQSVIAADPVHLASVWGGISLRLVTEYGLEVFRPYRFAWIMYALSAVFYGLVLAGLRRLEWGARSIFFAGCFFHAAGMLLRAFVAQRPPVTNMYESIIWVGFGIMLFAVFWQKRLVQCVASILACLCLLAADSALFDDGVHPLMPVLRSNYWLTVHVLTITLSYAAFALAMGLANAALFFWKRYPVEAIALVQTTVYRIVQIGVILVAAGTILGGIWADSSWGRFWGWDPKEVWALITLLCYAAILHARFVGWMRPVTFAIAISLAFVSVIMAWYGVNFVLGAGLHSYGFSQGGQGGVLGGVLIECAYVLWRYLALEKERKFL